MAPAASVLAAACASTTAQAPVSFKDVSVHDPSVILAGETYYIFGSHLAAAKSADLKNWEMTGAGANERNPLFINVREDLKETFEWAESRTLWAPDVVRLTDGRFALYYCACKGDSPRSALGLATSSRPEGPYQNQGILLKSGMWGQPSEDGRVYDPRIHPNAIDPSVFYDPEGRLWMVYGSYSGGIFIMKLDPKTGLRLPGQGYGRKLTGGNHARIEGAYILRSPETKLYYLYVSFGGLDSRGGYNIRVMRSRQPDGPYVDAAGNQMIKAMADPSKPLFDDRSIEPYGTKLAGGFQFRDGYGYVSPGHNSAINDPKTKRSFIILHARFPGKGEGHQVRVHELVMNAKGWPLIAPYRYASLAERDVELSEVPGAFEVINHGSAITSDLALPQEIRLEQGGRISGAHQGTWKLGAKGLMTLALGGVHYDGIILRQTRPEDGAKTLTFTALSEKGTALWGIRR